TEIEAPPLPPAKRGPLVQIIAWAIAALSLVAAGALVFGGMLLPAGVAALTATVSLVVALMQRGEPAATTEVGMPIRTPLGRGPHMHLVSPPTREVVRDLSHVASQLRDAATQQQWKVDWDSFQRMRTEAEQADKAGDYVAALQGHARTIMMVVDDLRRRRGELKHRSDSDVNLI
ncbi:MAG: hypothetical protein K8T25_10105, partial [Planctomycetia bacterium]|nr:hypothetical protein [Planctomycetia bacterium]